MTIVSENPNIEDLLTALLFSILALILGLHFEWKAADYISLAAIYVVFYLHVRTTRTNNKRFADIDEKNLERDKTEEERYVSEQRNNLIDTIFTLLSTTDDISFRIGYLLTHYEEKMDTTSLETWRKALTDMDDHAEEINAISKIYSDLTKTIDIHEINQVRANIMNSMASARTTATMLDEEFKRYSKDK